MTRTLSLVAVLACTFGCAPTLSTDSFQWTMALTSPEPTPLEADPTRFNIEWCPQLLFQSSVFDPVTGQPGPATTEAAAPHNILTSMSVENDDIYTLGTPFGNSGFASPDGVGLVFDIGPIGTFYAKNDVEYVINTDGSQPAATPPAINVVRRVVDGNVVDETEFNLRVAYDFDCGDDGKIVNGDASCECGSQSLTWNVKASNGQVF